MIDPNKLKDTDIMKINKMKEQLSGLLSGVMNELEVYKGKIDHVLVLQDILLQLDEVPVPNTDTMKAMAEIKRDLIRQVIEYIERG